MQDNTVSMGADGSIRAYTIVLALTIITLAYLLLSRPVHYSHPFRNALDPKVFPQHVAKRSRTNQRRSRLDSANAKAINFFDLPAELRNSVYELAYTFENKEAVDLRTARPPSNALLLACRQTYNEAAQFYLEAYRKYWTKSRFVLQNASKKDIDLFLSIKSKNLRRIQHLAVIGAHWESFGGYTTTICWLRDRWQWSYAFDDPALTLEATFLGIKHCGGREYGIVEYRTAEEYDHAITRSEVSSELDHVQVYAILSTFRGSQQETT